MKKICLLENPKSGSSNNGATIEKLLALLEEKNLDVTHEKLTSFEKTRIVIEEQIKSNCELFIVAGGDGTVRSVAQHLVDSNAAMLILPSGNENLLASELGLTSDPAKAIATILQGKTKNIDVAKINDSICIAVAGIGVDGAIVREVHKNRTGHINFFSYIWPTIKTFIAYKHRRIRVEIDKEIVCDAKAIAFIGNISRYGGGLKIFKDAHWDDGLLNITVLRCKNLFELLYLFALVIIGWAEKTSHIEHFKGKEITISSVHNDIKSQIDGDTGPDLPLKVKIIPGGLRLLIP